MGSSRERIAVCFAIVFAILFSLRARTLSTQETVLYEKVGGSILYHQGLKGSRGGLSAGEHAKRLLALGIDATDLEAESCALYVKEPLRAEEVAELAGKGIEVNTWAWIPPVAESHPFGFYLAKVRYTSLKLVEEDARFVRLESTELRLRRLNDLAATMIQVRAVQEGLGVTPRTGAGVKIAIADSGIDLSHADFPAPVEAFDLTDGSSPANWGTDVTDRISGHGTHVAGIALGRGTLSGGRYRGAAPDANLYFYKIGNDTDASASDGDMIESVLRAVEVGCDILSTSYGGYSDSMDGSESLAQAIDSAFARGTVCFYAAGNEAALGKHVSFEVPAAGSTEPFGFTIDNRAGKERYSLAEFFLVVRPPGSSASISLSASNLGAGESLVSTRSEASVRGTRSFWYTFIPSVPAGGAKTYMLALRNTSACNAPLVHVYATGFEGQGRFDRPDPRYTILYPALSDHAVAVGAWTSRLCWTNWLGNDYCFDALFPFFPEGTSAVNALAPFSSLGPRIDGLRKPDIAAPGHMTISCRDSVGKEIETFADEFTGIEGVTVIDNDGTSDGAGPANYILASGTSMATPMAAGAAALVLEANPSLSPLELVRALELSASSAESPNNDAGYGLLDVRRAIQLVESGLPDPCAASAGSPDDCNSNGVSDACEIASHAAADCNSNGQPDACEIASGSAADCNANGIPDECDLERTLSFGAPQSFGAGSRPGSLAAGDFDGDGDPDLVASNTGANTLTPLLNDGTGTFDAGASIGAASPSFVAAADLDGDGRCDVAAARSGAGLNPGTLSTAFNRGDGTFLPTVELAVGQSPSWVTAADLSGDGRLDLVVANNLSDNLSLLLNDGGGAFTAARELPAGEGPFAVNAVDLDGDADLDLATSNITNRTFTFLLNDGKGDFEPAGEIASAAGYGPLAFADLDGDSDLDLLALSRTCDLFSVWLNVGSGSFTPGSTLSTERDPASLAVADLDGDGHLDVALGNRISGYVTVFLGRGGAAFAPARQVGAGNQPSSLLAGDWNRDGKPDLAFASPPGNVVTRLLNQSTSGSSGDCNRDGVPDDCQLQGDDCNQNGVPDSCEIEDGAASDCNQNGLLDSCDIASGASEDCNANGAPDSCDLASGTSADRNRNGKPDDCEAFFVRGDCNGDGSVIGTVTDAVYLLSFNFLGGARPPCLAACDTNGDGGVIGTVTDAVYLLTFNFLGGQPPVAPFPDCGPSEREGDEALGCETPPKSCAGGM